MALLEPSDTGQFQDYCNSSRAQAHTCGYPIPMNCSGVPGMAYGSWPQGTFDHHVHTLLGNVLLWESGTVAAVPNCTQGVLARTFGALFGNASSTKLNYAELLTFVEVNIAGTVQYPDGVKLIVAEFASLFGTQAGERVRAWAIKHRWMLAWALGNNAQGQAPALYGKHLDQSSWSADGGRVLDPVVLGHSTANLSATPSGVAAFEEQWAAANSSAAGGGRPAAAKLRQFWAALPSGLRVSAGLRADDCADSNACIGVTAGGSCVCYAPGLGA